MGQKETGCGKRGHAFQISPGYGFQYAMDVLFPAFGRIPSKRKHREPNYSLKSPFGKGGKGGISAAGLYQKSPRPPEAVKKFRQREFGGLGDARGRGGKTTPGALLLRRPGRADRLGE